MTLAHDLRSDSSAISRRKHPVGSAHCLSLRTLLISVERLANREYWPTWVWYALIAPGLCWHTLRLRTVFAWLACNPGIECGGGWVGESKWAILRAMGAGEQIARSRLIAADADLEKRVAAFVRAAAELGSESGDSPQSIAGQHRENAATSVAERPAFQLILKPDIGERGHAVKLARSLDDAREYFRSVQSDVIVQACHPGPKECGILWARTLRPAGSGDGLPTGSIYSITAKEFPVLVCDGVRTFEQLILTHPRFRRQHSVFLSRFAKDALTVFPKGHEIRLGIAGNHCQGTMFFDGDHLRSKELERVIDSIASNFGRSVGAPDSLDFARFDVRYESDELLRQGKGFVIIEANGTSAESTNIYDPGRSLWWALGVLLGQWVILTKLGLWRTGRDSRNAPPAVVSPKPSLGTLRTIMSEAKAMRERRGGSAISD